MKNETTMKTTNSTPLKRGGKIRNFIVTFYAGSFQCKKEFRAVTTQEAIRKAAELGITPIAIDQI